ncbi:MAG: DUF1819 family protein [Methylococcaceae bacterium]|nr:DUF1819 family protein [Methylococcaceae bacterium]
MNSLYNAEIAAGSLMPLESRRIAGLLLTIPDEDTWSQALKTDNLLQKKTPATARRQARLIRKRLETLDANAWELIAHREQEVCIQLLLVGAIKHSRLLGDFIRDVYADHQRRLELHLSPRDWEGFLTECAHRDPQVAGWSTSTKAKLFQVIIRILAEAKYLDSTRSMTLTPQSLHPDVRRYLRAHGETSLLELLERAG